MKIVALIALAAFASIANGQQTLVMRAASATIPITMHEGTGTKQCALALASLKGSFSNTNALVIAGGDIYTVSCLTDSVFVPPVVIPPTSAASTVFSAPTYSTYLSLGKTYIPVKRQGSSSGSLVVNWSGVNTSPASGQLYWSANDSVTKYILLTPLTKGVATLSIPGSTASLTVQ